MAVFCAAIIRIPESTADRKSGSGGGKRGLKRKRLHQKSPAGTGGDYSGDDSDEIDDRDKRGGDRRGAGRPQKREATVPVSHDNARQSVCIGCLRNFGMQKRRQQSRSANELKEATPLMLKLCELLGGDFVYRCYDKRLPTYLCSTCSKHVLAAKDGDTIDVFQSTAAERARLTRSGISGFVRFRCPGVASCPLCLLATKRPFGRTQALPLPATDEPNRVVGVGDVNGLRRKFGISQNKSLRICRYFAERFRLPTEPYLRRDVSESNLQLAAAFEIVTTSTRTDADGTVIAVIDPQAYVDRLIRVRGMDPARVVVMMGIDKGDDTVKVSATLLQCDNDGIPRSVPIAGYKSSGVKAVQLLAIAVADETYDVVDELMSSLELKQRVFLCLDHKTKLTVTGVSGGSPSHQCDVCYWDRRSGDDEKHNRWNDEARTFNRNRQYHNAWVAAGSQKKNAQEYMNCTRPPIRFLDKYTGTIDDVVVLSGLHLTINIVSRLAIYGSEKQNSSNAECRQLMSTWLTADLHLKKHHGRDAWEGNKCITICSPLAIAKLRKRIGELKTSKAERLMGVVGDERVMHKATLYADALEAFHLVRKAAFGDMLCDNAAQCIDRFRAAYIALNIDVTRTVHVVLRHLLPFCTRWGCGLMHFIEQTHESVHQEFRRQLQLQYRANPQHPDAPRFLLQAVLIFNALRTLSADVKAEATVYDDANGSGDGGHGADDGGSAAGAAGDDQKHQARGDASRDDAAVDESGKQRGSPTDDQYRSTAQFQVWLYVRVYVLSVNSSFGSLSSL